MSAALKKSAADVEDIVLVEASKLEKWRPLLWSHVVALSRLGGNRVSPEYIWRSAKDDQAHLWALLRDVNVACLVMTRFVLYPQVKELHIVGVVSPDILQRPDGMLDKIAAWAKEQGCTRLCVTGRPDYLQEWPGFRLALITLERQI